jgi:VanZ family protein
MIDRTSHRVRVAALLLVLYWAALFVATHVPVSGVKMGHNGDKVAHFCAYAGLTFLLAWVVYHRRRLTRRDWLVLLIVAAIYGGVDELFQKFVPGRTADVWDWLADVCGAVVGIAAYEGVQFFTTRLADRMSRPTSLVGEDEG